MALLSSSVGAGFRFNVDAGRYVADSGRFVARSEVLRAASEFVERMRGEIASLGAALNVGAISIEQWQAQTAQALKNLHLASYAAGRGGFAAMTAADFGRVGAKLRFQYGRLDLFARKIEAGLLSPGVIATRVNMYANSGRGSYHDGENANMIAAGFEEERRVLGSAEHCDDCIEYADLGWSEIGSLPRIGDSACIVNCKCSFEYRRGSEVAEAA